jgi:hypothetical protein
MKRNLTLAFIAMTFVFGAVAQSTDEKPTMVAENMYIMPKRGMEEKFEAAVLAHDLKYHADGPYKAGLRKVEYGEKAGWYVWVFGPTTYASIDSRPTKEAGHADDWSKTVDPLIETYGATLLWDLNADLSYGMDILKKSNYYEVWSVDLKRGQYYRFKAICEKLKKAYEAEGKTAFLVWDNPVHIANGPDVALLWSFNSFDGWSKDMGVKSTFEKQNGAGSWQLMLDEWRDITVDYSSEIRSFVK